MSSFAEGSQFGTIVLPRDNRILAVVPHPRGTRAAPARRVSRRNPLGASALRLAGRLGDESTRDTAAGWPDLINRSHALPADK